VSARRRSPEAAALDRRDAVAAVLQARGDALVVTGLGAPTWDAAAAGDHHGNFYLWGGMGGAAMIGLGLAVAQPARRVLVITGDGELLMGLGSLATIAAEAPANLAILVIDNERYGETGMQPSHTGRGVDLAGVAGAAGFRHAETLRVRDDLQAWIPRAYADPGPLLAVAKVSAHPAPLVVPPRDGAYLKHRFQTHLLGERSAG
jgi:thiamine pyrophosphate-dependent acetolactate synthase large subunit-like protein